MNTDEKKALEYLKKDFLQNCNLISAINIAEKTEYIYTESDGICFKMLPEDMIFLSSDSFEASDKILKNINDMNIFIVQHEYEKKAVCKKFNLNDDNCVPCYQVLYNTDKEQPVPEDIKIRKLDRSFSKFVSDNYRMNITVGEVSRTMDTFGMYGAFIDGKIAGFIGRHEEGSIGMLEVFSDYQHKGIGSALVNRMVNLCKEHNQIAFSQIVHDNIKSLKMNQKLDCRISSELIYWCFAK